MGLMPSSEPSFDAGMPDLCALTTASFYSREKLPLVLLAACFRTAFLRATFLRATENRPFRRGSIWRVQQKGSVT